MIATTCFGMCTLVPDVKGAMKEDMGGKKGNKVDMKFNTFRFYIHYLIDPYCRIARMGTKFTKGAQKCKGMRMHKKPFLAI